MSKVSFLGYVKDRLGGFEVDTEPSGAGAVVAERSSTISPSTTTDYFKKYSSAVTPLRRIICTGPITYVGQELLQIDIDNLKAAVEGTGRDRDLHARHRSERLRPQRLLRRRTRSTSGTSPRRCGRSTSASSRPASSLQVDDPVAHRHAQRSDRDDRAERRKAASAPRRGAQPRAARHPDRPHPPPHLLRPQPWAAAQRHPADTTRSSTRFQINAGAYSFEVVNPRHMHEWHQI